METVRQFDVSQMSKDLDRMINTIKIRRSIRTYQSTPLHEDHVRLIEEYLETDELLKGPFGRKFRIEFLQKSPMEKNMKIGTYGYVKNSQGYLVGLSDDDPLTLFEIAYVFHGLVLLLTSEGVGTCWLGGIFNQDSVRASTFVSDDEIVPAISPVGYRGTSRTHVFGKLAPIILKPHKRMPVEEIAFQGNFDTPFTETDHPLHEALYLATLAPSAQNKQSWRVVVSNDLSTVHLYVKFNLKKQVRSGFRGYACPPEYLDIGIFYKQFELAMKYQGIEGSLETDNPGLKTPHEDMGYVVSWKISHQP